MRDKTDLRLAVLIDADNIPYSKIKEMLDEIAKFGIPTIKRIYGDWAAPRCRDGSLPFSKTQSLLYNNTATLSEKTRQTRP